MRAWLLVLFAVVGFGCHDADLSSYATKSSLAKVATSGSYGDLSEKPDLSGYATTASLAPVASSGSYQDLLDKPVEVDPTIAAQTAGKWCASDGTHVRCDVAPPVIDYAQFDGVQRKCATGGTQTFDGPTATWGTCSRGFFVLTSTTFGGNLGGLIGANTACLKDLQANDWLGKDEALLDRDHVRAFLCTTSTCNNLQPDVVYAFARSGDATVGGARFTTSDGATGPADDANWSDATHFGVTATYFSSRGNLSGTEWSSTPDPEAPPSSYPVGSLQCANWTDGTSGTGNWTSRGNTNSTGSTRWFASGTHPYCGPNRLVCIVDP